MPRTLWEAKNPYCRRSKLTKEVFERVAYFYFLEITAGWSRRVCSEMLRVGEEGEKVSRQTMSTYFDAIGAFLWEEMVVPTDPRYVDESVLDDLLDCVHGKKERVSFIYDLVPAYLKTVPLEAKHKDADFHRTLLFHLLHRRAKATRGLKRDQFRLEVARAFFVCACAQARGMDTARNEGILEYRAAKETARLAWSVLLDILIQHPLDRVEG